MIISSILGLGHSASSQFSNTLTYFIYFLRPSLDLKFFSAIFRGLGLWLFPFIFPSQIWVSGAYWLVCRPLDSTLYSSASIASYYTTWYQRGNIIGFKTWALKHWLRLGRSLRRHRSFSPDIRHNRPQNLHEQISQTENYSSLSKFTSKSTISGI